MSKRKEHEMIFTQNLPIDESAMLSSKIVKNATLKIYPGGPYGLTTIHKDQVNADLLSFIGGS